MHVGLVRPRHGGPVHGPPALPASGKRSRRRRARRRGRSGGSRHERGHRRPLLVPARRGQRRPHPQPRPGPARARRPRPRDHHGAAARRRTASRRGRPGEYEGVTYECVAPTTAAVVGVAGRRSRRSPGCGAASPTRSAGSRASTGRRCAPGAGCASASTRAECDLVFVYDRSAVRMTPLVRALPEAAGALRARRDRDERAPREPAEPPLLGLRPGHALHDAPLRRPHRHHHRTRGLLPRAGLRADPGRPRGRGVASRRLRLRPPGTPRFRLAYVGSLLPRDAPEALFETVRLVAGQGLGATVDVIGHYEGTERGERFARLCAAGPGSCGHRALPRHPERRRSWPRAWPRRRRDPADAAGRPDGGAVLPHPPGRAPAPRPPGVRLRRGRRLALPAGRPRRRAARPARPAPGRGGDRGRDAPAGPGRLDRPRRARGGRAGVRPARSTRRASSTSRARCGAGGTA